MAALWRKTSQRHKLNWLSILEPSKQESDLLQIVALGADWREPPLWPWRRLIIIMIIITTTLDTANSISYFWPATRRAENEAKFVNELNWNNAN